MKEENKARLLVIPIIAMLAVTMVVAGWQYEEEQEIDVEEGYDEVEVEVPAEHGPSKSHPQNGSHSAIAVSSINGEESLELNVTPRTSFVSSGIGIDGDTVLEYWNLLWVSVDGNIPAELEPDELVIETEVKEGPNLDDIVLNHPLSQWEAEDLDLWPLEELKTGTGGEEPLRIGSDIENNNFSSECEIQLVYHERDIPFDEPITIEVTATLRGLAEEVTARTDVTFEKEDG